LSEIPHTVKEGQLVGLVAFFKIIEELILEELRQDPNRKEESLSTGNPALFLRGQTTAGDDTMNMGMVHEILSPGVNNSDEADVGAETLGVPGQFQKGLGDRAKEKVIEGFAVS